MKRCVLCGNQRAEFEMRPLVNVKELALGNQLSEADKAPDVEAERKVGDSVLQIVCRSCWLEILNTKDKATILEMFETICGLLFEMDRRVRERERAQRPVAEWPDMIGGGDVIEKQMPLRRTRPITNPWPVKFGVPMSVTGLQASNASEIVINTSPSPTSAWSVGGRHVDASALVRLGNDWEDGLAGCAAHQP